MQRNVFVAHCYGVTHTLRLLKWLSMENRISEVAGVVMLAIGSNVPSSVGFIAKMPAFFLGKRKLTNSMYNSWKTLFAVVE